MFFIFNAVKFFHLPKIFEWDKHDIQKKIGVSLIIRLKRVYVFTQFNVQDFINAVFTVKLK